MPESSEYTRLGDGGNQSLFARWQYLTRLEKSLILITTVFGIVIFSLAVALATCNAQVPPNVTTVAPDTTTIKPTSTTVKPNSTTVEPTSTTVKPTSTTVEPTSTTVKPTSTTVKPTSTTVKPTSTTVKPTSTTVEPTSTTVQTTTTTLKPPTSENVKQLNAESVSSSEPLKSVNASKLLEIITPMPTNGVKVISDETVTAKNFYKKEGASNLSTEEPVERYTIIPDDAPEDSTSKLLSSKLLNTTPKPVMSDEKQEISTEAFIQKYSEVPADVAENSTSKLLLRTKRIDNSSTNEGQKNDSLYE